MSVQDLITMLSSIVGPLLGGVAAYYAIRQDLAVLRVRVEHHSNQLEQLGKRADQAHARIDEVLSKG